MRRGAHLGESGEGAEAARDGGGVGRLEYLGAVEPAATGMDGVGGRARRGNSAQRLKQVHDAFRPGPALAGAVAAHQGPILLVDDRVDTGWTMTVAARMLRQAGPAEVLPFALALEAWADSPRTENAVATSPIVGRISIRVL